MNACAEFELLRSQTTDDLSRHGECLITLRYFLHGLWEARTTRLSELLQIPDLVACSLQRDTYTFMRLYGS